MVIYENKQPGSKFILSMVVLISMISLAALVWSMYYCPGSKSCPISKNLAPVIIIPTVLIIIYVFLFLFSLTVKISDKKLVLIFGPGVFKKTIDLESVENAQVVKNSVAHGWGIHYYKGAKVYNVAGFEAVELRLNSGKCIRIGTNQPDILKEAIEREL